MPSGFGRDRFPRFPLSPSTKMSNPFPIAPPPWKTKCTAYLLAFNASSTTPLPRNRAYTPLNASHAPFSSPAECGEFRGGLGMLQVLRYTETPVGPYDELAVMPGLFDTPVGEKGRRGKTKQNSRITAIWVSQKETTWNGEFVRFGGR